MAARTFITGGAGFIGSRLSRRMAQSGDVLVFDNLHPQVHARDEPPADLVATPNVSFIKGDVRDGAVLRDTLRAFEPNIVVHLTSETGTGQSFDEVGRYCAVNVQGTAELVEAIRGVSTVSRVVLASSRAVYGEGACVDLEGRLVPAVERTAADMTRGEFRPKDRLGHPLTPVSTSAHTCPPRPSSIYASTKLMQEFILSQAFWGTDVSVAIARLQNVYGAGQSVTNPYTGVVAIFAKQIMDGKRLRIYEDGEITRDFVHVDDVVDALAALALRDHVPEDVVDIGSGTPTTIADVARALLEVLGKASDNYDITGEFRPGDVRHAVADITHAASELGWSPRVDFKSGLAALVDWMRRDGAL